EYSCFSMGLLISSNAQANYNLAKSSLDEIHRDAQIELNKAIESGKKARPNLAKLTPFLPYILNGVKDFNSLSQQEQFSLLGNRLLMISNSSDPRLQGFKSLFQSQKVDIGETAKDLIISSTHYKLFEKLRKFEENNMSYLSDIQHGPNLIASQYAELQFNLHMLNKMNKFQSGAYADLVNTSLYEKEVNVKMPYLVVGYQYQIGNNMKLGTFANFAVDSISRNSKYSKDDEAIGIGFNASYKWGASTIALLTNIIRHNQSFTANQSEIFTVYPPTARYHLYSGNVTFKADYAYQTTAALSLTPGLTYQYNYTQGKEVETNYLGADFTSP
ncbi:autotransporter domain-containing protein, partial [Avibacterium paragallinarum]